MSSESSFIPSSLPSTHSSSDSYPRIYYTQNLEAGLYEYDVITGRYSVHPLPSITFHNTSTCLLPSGDIFLAGSYIQHSYSPMTYIYKPKSCRMMKLSDMKVARNCIALIYYKGFVYGFGGYNDLFLVTAEKYCMKNNRWQQLPDMKEARFYLSCVGVEDKIYIFAGGSVNVEEYNINHNRFRITDVSIFSRSGIAHMKDDRIYLLCNNEMVTMDKNLKVIQRDKKRTHRNCQSISNTVFHSETLYYFNISSLEIEKFRLRKPDDASPYAKWVYVSSAKTWR
jgi:hypothetical protein